MKDETDAFLEEMTETLKKIGLHDTQIVVVKLYCSTMAIITTRLLSQGQVDSVSEVIANAEKMEAEFKDGIETMKRGLNEH